MTPQEERLVLELHARWGNRFEIGSEVSLLFFSFHNPFFYLLFIASASMMITRYILLKTFPILIYTRILILAL
jgi:hypothetical protein